MTRKRQLNIQVEPVQSVAIVHLNGSVDAANIHDFEQALEPLCLVPRPRVILNCGRLTYVNSTSYDLLFHFHRVCRTRRGHLLLYGVRRKIMEIMRVLSLDSVLEVFPSRQEALRRLTQKSRSKKHE